MDHILRNFCCSSVKLYAVCFFITCIFGKKSFSFGMLFYGEKSVCKKFIHVIPSKLDFLFCKKIADNDNSSLYTSSIYYTWTDRAFVHASLSCLCNKIKIEYTRIIFYFSFFQLHNSSTFSIKYIICGYAYINHPASCKSRPSFTPHPQL